MIFKMGIQEQKQVRGKALTTPQDAVFAANLKQFRELAGLSLGDVARSVADTYNVPWQASTVYKIENGRKVSIGEAQMIATAIDVPLEALVSSETAKTGFVFASILWSNANAVHAALMKATQSLRDLRDTELRYAQNFLTIAKDIDQLNIDTDPQGDGIDLNNQLSNARKIVSLNLGDSLLKEIWANPKIRDEIKTLIDDYGDGYPEEFENEKLAAFDEKHKGQLREEVNKLLNRLSKGD